MRFVCNWSAPDAGKDPGYASACVGYMNSGKPMDQFDGFQVISRVFYPQSGGGMMPTYVPTHDGYETDQPDDHGGVQGKDSTSEVYIRNMYDAWLNYMTAA